MRKFKNVQKNVTTTELVECACNFCGKTVIGEDDYLSSDITEFIISPGYGSGHDSDRIYFDICDDCLDNLIDSSKIRPKIQEIF